MRLKIILRIGGGVLLIIGIFLCSSSFGFIMGSEKLHVNIPPLIIGLILIAIGAIMIGITTRRRWFPVGQ